MLYHRQLDLFHFLETSPVAYNKALPFTLSHKFFPFVPLYHLTYKCKIKERTNGWLMLAYVSFICGFRCKGCAAMF